MHVSGVEGETRKAEGYSEIHAALARDARERFKVESAGLIDSICKHHVSHTVHRYNLHSSHIVCCSTKQLVQSELLLRPERRWDRKPCLELLGRVYVCTTPVASSLGY